MPSCKARSLLAFVSLLAANTASAVTVSFSLPDFLISTTKMVGVNLGPLPSSAPALPADASFTLPADSVISLPPNASNTYLAASEGMFLRYSFTLPAGFHDLAFSFDALVNDEFALYVNGTVVAIQGSTGTDNFDVPLPGFTLASTGVATDTSNKLEYLLTDGMQPLFHAGTNELTVFATDTWMWGGVGSINGTISAVPETQTYGMMLAGLGLLALFVRQRPS